MGCEAAGLAMSRHPEQRLWDRLRANLGRKVHIERIENGVGSGTPDTLIIHRSRVTWAEHKVAELPKRTTTRLQWKHPLTPEQCNWHLMWHKNGGNSFIVVGVNTDLFAVPGEFADEVTGMTALGICNWSVTYSDLLRIYQTGSRR